MSMTFEQGLAQPVRQLLTRIADTVTAALERQRRDLAIRRTRRALHELPDWMLRDIGISRGEIHEIAVTTYDHPGEDPRCAWRIVP